MSEKKNTPTPPPSDVRSRTTYTVTYVIDGELYFEERSLDIANGDFLGPLGIKKHKKSPFLYNKKKLELNNFKFFNLQINRYVVIFLIFYLIFFLLRLSN